MIKVILVNEAPDGGYRTPFTPALRAFAANRPIEGDIQGHPVTPFPGLVEEAWFDDLTDVLQAYGNPDLASLTAPDNALRFIAREYIVVAGPAGPFPATGVKLFSFLKRQPHMTIEEFQAYWRDIHAPLVVHTPRLRRYVQSHFLLEHFADGRTPPCDGVAELWWDSMEDFIASWTSPQMQVDQFTDARKFLNGGIFRCLARETSIPGPTQGAQRVSSGSPR